MDQENHVNLFLPAHLDEKRNVGEDDGPGVLLFDLRKPPLPPLKHDGMNDGVQVLQSPGILKDDVTQLFPVDLPVVG